MGLYTATNLPHDGESIDAADVNTDLQGLIDEFNGNIESDNLKDGAVTNAKLAGSIANTKLLLGDFSQDMAVAAGWTTNAYIQTGIATMGTSVDPGGGYYVDVTFEKEFANVDYVAFAMWVGDTMTKVFDVGIDLSSKTTTGCRFKSQDAIGAWQFYYIVIGQIA